MFRLNNSIQHVLIYPFKSLKGWICIILFPCFVYAQNTSEKYNAIINSEDFNVEQKDRKADSLFATYEANKELELLFYDLYTHAKWHYSATENFDKAIELCKKGVDIANTLESKGVIVDEDILAGTMFNIGFFYEIQGAFKEAFLAYKNETKKITIPNRLARAYYKMGDCKSILGDFFEASDYFETALAIAKKNNLLFLHLIIANNASNNYKKIDRPYYYKKGIKLLTEVIHNVDSQKLDINTLPTNYLLNIYNNLANLYSESQDYAQAETYLLKAISFASERENQKALGYLYSDLGYVYVKAQKPNAITYLDKGLKLLDNTESISICYSNKALYYALHNDKTNTLLYADKAINVLLPEDHNALNKTSVVASLYKTELLTALIEKAEYLIKFNDTSTANNNLTNALELYRLSDILVDDIRFNSTEQESQLLWRDLASKIYTNATKVCYALEKKDDAFYFMEKNKAILL